MVRFRRTAQNTAQERLLKGRIGRKRVREGTERKGGGEGGDEEKGRGWRNGTERWRGGRGGGGRKSAMTIYRRERKKIHAHFIRFL